MIHVMYYQYLENLEYCSLYNRLIMGVENTWNGHTHNYTEQEWSCQLVHIHTMDGCGK